MYRSVGAEVREAPKMVSTFVEKVVTDWRRTRIEIWRCSNLTL